MKTTPHQGRAALQKFAFLLLLFVSVFAAACERLDPQAEVGGHPLIQGANNGQAVEIIGPNGPCSIDRVNQYFEVGQTLKLPSATETEWDFAVELSITKDCQQPEGPNVKCELKAGEFKLYFPTDRQSPDYVSLWDDFAYIWSVPLNATSNPDTAVYLTPSAGNSLSVPSPSTIYFKWDDDEVHDIPAMTSGGICIIGIITEPCPHCGPHGRPLTRIEGPLHGNH